MTKSGKARRVDLSRKLGLALAALKSLQDAEAALVGRSGPARIFSMPNGTAIHDDSFRNHVWAPIPSRAGLRYRKPHTLRHTFATIACTVTSSRGATDVQWTALTA
jgi:integrase